MKCEICGEELSSESLEVNSCMKCGAIIDIDAPVKDISQYKRKAEFVDSIQNLMNTNLTVNRSQEEQKQETLKKVNDAFEYRVEIVPSNPDGTVSAEKLNSQLKVYSEKGWRLANSFCNVIGKSQVAGYGGVTGGLAASGAVPITQIIFIFERRTGSARRIAPPTQQGQANQGQGNPGGIGMKPQGAPAQGAPAGPNAAVAPKNQEDLFAGKKPTPRPMTPQELEQLNKQKPVNAQNPGDGQKTGDGQKQGQGSAGDDGKPRIIPLR
ncbi:MAG: hypothetical protein IKO32_10100 [Lachnospiraceae bacterium]|nr:hypothetical protein [Lachnospiraceae bacterium]